MSILRIASRYAKSLIDLANEQGKLERILGDINSFLAAVQNRDLYLLLKSPIVHADKKHQILTLLFGDKFDETTNAFIRLIVTKGREAYLPEIAQEFVEQYKKSKNIITVKLTTAGPMDEATVQAIKKRLIEEGVAGENMELNIFTNPKLIGGFVIEFDDRLYDASVAHKLDMLKKEFSSKHYQKQF